jgi:high affinity Mn2+ porin
MKYVFQARPHARRAAGVVRCVGLVLALGTTYAVPAVTRGEEPEVQNRDVKAQTTYAWQRKPPFDALYSGRNSLSAGYEKSYTWTATLYAGTKTWWQGGEVYFNPELIQSVALSNLTGLGGLSNGENQKGSGPNPKIYNARLFLRQAWGFGGGDVAVESAFNQLAGQVDRRRLVLTAGKLALIDVFDNNSFSHDPRTQFMNWSLMTHGAFDYAADSRGYSWGATLEYYYDDWAFRIGRFEQPKESNGLPLDSRIMAHYGDNFEVEHAHEIAGQPGKIRVLAFRNTAKMGGFRDAIDYARINGGEPAVGNVRKERFKNGAGISLEQYVNKYVGLFARASWNDDQSETYAFTEIGNSLSGGVFVKGTAWNRAGDTAGLAFVSNGLSSAHRDYLAAGGHGFFIGDGQLNYRREQIIEGYYNLNVSKNSWVSFDYQRIVNPAYNAARGPANIYGLRLHLEY